MEIMNSDLSNYRRNAHHMINIKKSKIDPSLIDVVTAIQQLIDVVQPVFIFL